MTHYTVLVCISGNEAIDRARNAELGGKDGAVKAAVELRLEQALAPFDENKAVTAYREYEEDKPEDYWLYSSLQRAGKDERDGTGIKPYKPDQLGWSSDSSKETADAQQLEIAKKAALFRTLPEPVTWESLFDAHAILYPGEEIDRTIDDDGRAYQMSTYNPQRFGLVSSVHVEGSQARQSAGTEVLFEVRDDQATGGVSEGSTVSRRSIHVLLPVHPGTQLPTDTGTKATLAHPAEVQDQPAGVRADADSSAESLRDLPEPAAAAHDGRRSRSLHGGSAGLALSALQHGTRLAPGFSIRAENSSELPSAPTGFEWTLIGGSKWDWYVIGGRWGGYLLRKPDSDPGMVIGPKKDWNSPDHFDFYSCDGAPKGLVDLEAMRAKQEKEARERWQQFHAIADRFPGTRSWEYFRGLLDVELTIDEARKGYREQPGVIALKDTDFMWANDPYADYALPEDEYAENARAAAVPGYALLTTDGRWTEPGQMGWFGMSTDTQESREDYQKFANQYIEALPDDTWLVAVDVHI